MSFANVKNAQPLFFKILFQPHSSYPFLLGSNDINVGSFVIRSLGICSFIFGSNQVNSFDLSFSSLITFTVTQLCSSSNKFLLIYVIIFFSFIIFIWIFTIASNYLSKFSIFKNLFNKNFSYLDYFHDNFIILCIQLLGNPLHIIPSPQCVCLLIVSSHLNCLPDSWYDE